ncbi:SDR family oxidoreductase [Paenibacillus sp. TAB 01]|uniref:SDR family oxidoreductase n=1 Tax=Paenibacillus sp. TAB 01 TaxID=3368988 RepID=UPI0037521FDD
MIRGKTALITGGSQGIGLAVMHSLLEEGALVGIMSRNAQHLQAAIESVNTLYKHNVTGIQADVREESEVRQAVQQMVSQYGTIDYLINSAGVSMREKQALQDTDVNEWKNMIDINLTGTYLMCREVFPYMTEKQSGYIINILSTAAFRSGKENSLYSASKYGARALTESIMEENRRSGVRITSVSPGAVDTTIWDHKKHPISAEDRETMLQAGDIAGIIVYLLNLPLRVYIDNITVTPWLR